MFSVLCHTDLFWKLSQFIVKWSCQFKLSKCTCIKISQSFDIQTAILEEWMFNTIISFLRIHFIVKIKGLFSICSLHVATTYKSNQRENHTLVGIIKSNFAFPVVRVIFTLSSWSVFCCPLYLIASFMQAPGKSLSSLLAKICCTSKVDSWNMTKSFNFENTTRSLLKIKANYFLLEIK